MYLHQQIMLWNVVYAIAESVSHFSIYIQTLIAFVTTVYEIFYLNYE